MFLSREIIPEVVRVSWASPISVHVGVPFGRSVFVVFAATPTFATEAVPSVALVASSVEAVVPGMAIAFPALVVVSAATSTLIEMPHAAHPIVSVFFNFAFLSNDVNADSVSSFTVFNLIPDRDGASCALFDSFDCWTTPSSTKLCQITLVAYRVHRCLFPG